MNQSNASSHASMLLLFCFNLFIHSSNIFVCVSLIMCHPTNVCFFSLDEFIRWWEINLLWIIDCCAEIIWKWWWLWETLHHKHKICMRVKLYRWKLNQLNKKINKSVRFLIRKGDYYYLPDDREINYLCENQSFGYNELDFQSWINKQM